MIQSSSLVVSNTPSLLSEHRPPLGGPSASETFTSKPHLPELPGQHGKPEGEERRSDVFGVPRRRAVEMTVQRLLAVYLERVDAPGGVLERESANCATTLAK